MQIEIFIKFEFYLTKIVSKNIYKFQYEFLRAPTTK